MKPIVLIVSRQFQTKHPRKGQPTNFADKIKKAHLAGDAVLVLMDVVQDLFIDRHVLESGASEGVKGSRLDKVLDGLLVHTGVRF